VFEYVLLLHFVSLLTCFCLDRGVTRYGPLPNTGVREIPGISPRLCHFACRYVHCCDPCASAQFPRFPLVGAQPPKIHFYTRWCKCRRNITAKFYLSGNCRRCDSRILWATRNPLESGLSISYKGCILIPALLSILTLLATTVYRTVWFVRVDLGPSTALIYTMTSHRHQLRYSRTLVYI